MAIFDHLMNVLRGGGAELGRMPTRFVGREGQGNEPDPEDLLAEATEDAESLGLTFFIFYEAASGETTERMVTVNRLQETESDVRLMCYCHLRSAPRQFLASRIVEIEDPETGEIIDEPADILRRLAGLARRPAESEEAATQEALKVCRTGFTVLLGLARADGDLDSAEKEVLIDFVDHHSQAPGCDAELVGEIVDWTYPTGQEIEKAWLALRFVPELRERTKRYLHRLVVADGRLADAEFDLLEAFAALDRGD